MSDIAQSAGTIYSFTFLKARNTAKIKIIAIRSALTACWASLMHEIVAHLRLKIVLSPGSAVYSISFFFWACQFVIVRRFLALRILCVNDVKNA